MSTCMSKQTMQEFHHFLHHHPLQQIKNDSAKYTCDGCNIPGIGSRFRCNICNFDLHEFCATSSPTLASFLHPQHQLSLEVCASQNASQNSRLCGLCGDQVEGLFYRCKICDFDIHLVCTQLPEFVHHALHMIHPLKLEAGPAGCCSICYNVCTTWRYRCGTCGVNIHLECILAPPPPIPPPSAPPPFYGGYGADGYPMYNTPHQYANAYQYGSSSTESDAGYAMSKGPHQYANAYQYGNNSTGYAAGYAMYNGAHQYANAYQYGGNSNGYAAGYAMYNGPYQYANACQYGGNSTGYDAGYAMYNGPYQYASAYQYGSSSTGSAASNGKIDIVKKIGLFVGRVAINLASGIVGIPDVSSFFF